MPKKITNDVFIQLSINIWGNVYDYSKTNYINTSTKVLIICEKHGEFYQLPSNHYKYGCKRCGNESNIRNITLNNKCKEDFVEKANRIHNFRYDYSKACYKNVTEKLIVICRLHGEFMITPNNHLNKKGCAKCGKENLRRSKIKTFEEYHKYFLNVHGDKYDYSNVVWSGASNSIDVICKNHGLFAIKPYIHKQGSGCYRCSNRHSKISIDWLNYMEIKYSVKIQHAQNDGEFIIPGTRYKADGYAKDINTIFEFNGDFWHGNPQLYCKTDIHPRIRITFNQLYEQTNEKSEVIISKGYNLISIWEYDWKKFINAICKLQKKWRYN